MRIRKDFENGLSANIKFSKNQLSKMMQLEGFIPFFNFMLSPVKATNEIINKIHNLASKVSDNKFNKIVDVADIFIFSTYALS